MSSNSEGKTLGDRETAYLSKLYGNPQKVGSLGGIQRLYNAVKKDGKYKITLKQLKKWLQSSDTYTLHKLPKRKFKRNRVIVGDIGQQWSMDIAQMDLLRKENKNYRYFLLAIDVFSKFVKTAPLKTKSGPEVAAAFKKMLPKKKGIPRSLHTDRGTEFTGATFQKLLKERRIKHFFTNNELKSMVAERAIKTIKLKLYQYFTESRRLNWIDHLADITETYNETRHRSIGMSPVEVTPSKTAQVWEKLYPSQPLEEPEPFKFDINDKVRISFTKSPFERAYNYFWTGEIFIVTEKYHKEGIAKYRLKDWNNETVEGSFYGEELQKVDVDENTAYKIEKILRRRTRNGQKELLVKWYLWGEAYNSWIPETDLEVYS